MFRKVLQRMQANGSPLNASCESSSLGPSFFEHDPRVVRLAREAGLQLAPKTQRSFDEVRDPVKFDLILAMDKFDFDEVCPGLRLGLKLKTCAWSRMKLWLHSNSLPIVAVMYERRGCLRY